MSIHLSLIDTAIEDVHPDVARCYDSILQSFLAQVAGRILDCGAVYRYGDDKHLVRRNLMYSKVLILFW